MGVDFYNETDNLFYPFKDNSELITTPSGDMPKKGIADASFLIGALGQFDLETSVVHLEGFIKSPTTLIFEFRADSIGMLDRHWLFQFNLTDPFGTSKKSFSTLIAGGGGNANYGVAWMTVGNLSDFAALGSGTYLLSSMLEVLDSRVQSLHKSYVTTVNVANGARRCPTICCNSSSSSSSPDPEEAFTVVTDLTGDIKFREGYNSRLLLDPSINLLTFGGVVGAGAGEPCTDILIDESGIHPNSTCQACEDFIGSINGLGSLSERFNISVGPGMRIDRDQDNHKLEIIVDDAQLCG